MKTSLVNRFVTAGALGLGVLNSSGAIAEEPPRSASQAEIEREGNVNLSRAEIRTEAFKEAAEHIREVKNAIYKNAAKFPKNLASKFDDYELALRSGDDRQINEAAKVLAKGISEMQVQEPEDSFWNSTYMNAAAAGISLLAGVWFFWPRKEEDESPAEAIRKNILN